MTVTPGLDETGRAPGAWPVLRRYDADHLARISLPLGGIGTGTIGLGGRGDLRDFEVGNRPAKGFRPGTTQALFPALGEPVFRSGTAFFAIRARRGDGAPQARLLEGPLPPEMFEGGWGVTADQAGVPRYARARFESAYPFGQVVLEDDELPRVVIQGFNPLIPGDLESSSLPVAILRFVVANDDASPLEVTIAGSVENFIGANGTLSDTGGNSNTVVRTDRLVGVRMTAPELDPGHEAAGEFVLAAVIDDATTVSTRANWGTTGTASSYWHWGQAILDFWDDLLEDGRLDERETSAARPNGSIANSIVIPSGETRAFTFLLTWVFPNRRAWWNLIDPPGADVIVGNAYAVKHPDPWQTALDVAAELPSLEERTVRAISPIVDSATPLSIREAALSNVSTLRSQTVFQTADGRFFGWEGVDDRTGTAFGTCSHVWGYEFASSYWFPELAWSFRDTQYALATDERGLMSFRVGLPLDQSRRWPLAAADGQMACLVHLLHDWRLSGDDERLRRLWPAARRSLEFAWIPGGWDADQDGVMEGCQHNTMDVEYYGPNPQMATWYLAALRACARIADHLEETEFADKCRALFESGSRWIDDNLFTGSHYRQEISRPAGGFVAEGLRFREPPSDTHADHSQLGEGVLIDQLVGQYAARLTGLGELLDSGHVRTTLDTIFERNFRPNLRGHLCNLRSFALQDEAAVLMCSYEVGKAPQQPFPFFTEVMTGFEYTLAAGHIQDGRRDTAVTIIDAIRARYDGRRRNPFDEAEAGHHYARAMASWSTFVAWNGFVYDAQAKEFAIDLHEAEGSTFWSTGRAFGTWRQWREDARLVAALEVIEGEIQVERVVSRGVVVELAGSPSRSAGDTILVPLTDRSDSSAPSSALG